jgi:hypothetical protein
MEYVALCPTCASAKPSRRLPWGALQPIQNPRIPLSTLSIDFITGLPLSHNGNNACLSITCKTSKFVRLIPGKETYTAVDWADLFYCEVWSQWGMPDPIISDRDLKFASAFWRRLFEKSKTRLAFTYAYHQAANSQAERTIQTVEHVLQCAIGNRYNQRDWENIIPYIQYVMNTSENASTGVLPYRFLFGCNPKPIFADNLSELEFLADRDRLQGEAIDAVQLTQAKIKLQYDNKHTNPLFNTG